MSTADSLIMQPASEIVAQPIEWLWPSRIPLGMLSLLAGDAKTGKSAATISLAAAVSRGLPLPASSPPDGPGSVVMLNAEDDPSRTVVPRLEAAGPDLSRVHVVRGVRRKGGIDPFPHLKHDMEAIAERVDALSDCRLVVVDPLTAYLGAVADGRGGALREALSPLHAAAERLGVAVVMVTHLTKSAGKKPLHQVLGSIALAALCRANFVFSRDPSDLEGRRMLMDSAGCNLAAPRPLTYEIVDRNGVPLVVWGDEVASPGSAEEPHRVDAWLSERMNTGPQPANLIVQSGREAGFSEDQLKRAKKRLGIASQREGFGSGSRSLWVSAPPKASVGQGSQLALPPPIRLALPAPAVQPGREIVLWRPPTDEPETRAA